MPPPEYMEGKKSEEILLPLPVMKTSSGGDNTLRDKLMTMYASIYAMRKELDGRRHPIGSQANPGRSCRDIYLSHAADQRLDDGWYWIDPNLGVIEDSIQVFCNMSAGGHTCLMPDPERSSASAVPRAFILNKWFSELPDGEKISYDRIGSAQVNFLSLMSSRAYQNLTYTCIDSVAYQDHLRSGLIISDRSIKLLGQSSVTFGFVRPQQEPEVKRVYELVALKDECRDRNANELKRTVVEIRTEQANQLPIVDIMPRDYGRDGQAFGFEVGPVCFV